MKNSNIRAGRRATPFGAWALALGMFLGVAASNAYTLPVVEVGPNLYQSIMNQINTLQTQISATLAQGQAEAEFAENLTRWNSTLSNWSQKLAKYDQMLTGMSFQREIPIERIPQDFNVEEKCGGSGGFSLAQLASTLSQKMTGSTSITEQRYRLCAAIQLLENKKHNDTVDMLQKSLPEMQGILAKISDIRLFISEGTMAESTNNSVQSANRITMSFEKYEQENKLIDQYILALQRQQQVLTTRALNGDKSNALTGFIMQAGTMGIALDAADKKTDK